MNKVVSISSKNKFSGETLKKSRLFRGYTLEEVAESVSVSQQMLSKYEKNISVPTVEVISEISKKLNFPISYFYVQSEIANVEAGFYRKGSSVSKRSKQKVAELATYAADILEEIKKVITLPSYKDPIEIKRTTEYSPISFNYIEDVAQSIRNKFSFGIGPIINLTGFLESLGIFIVFTNLESDKIDAYTIDINGAPIILINSIRTSSSRIRFNLAHEFAHILFHRDYEKKYNNGGKFMTIENEANFFASCFLLPEEGLASDLVYSNMQHLITLKSHWRVSIAAIITRANYCELFSDSHTLHLRQVLSRNGWRKKEPLDDELAIEYPVIINQALKIYADKLNVNALERIATNLRVFPDFISEVLYNKPIEPTKDVTLKLIR
ncbi:helix-turn-helix domain-containing protein [Carnobacterium maltaromaticum]|uniref:helix-turn-helix domain-containing protein n=1 Tax=Carnobacterium maltaromaticum TaxID=2751 RepID=UPI0039BDA4EE